MGQELTKEQICEFWDDDRKQLYTNLCECMISTIVDWDREYAEQNGVHFIRFIEQRLKKADSIYEKLQRKNRIVTELKHLPEQIHDLAGIRIICFDTEQIYRVVQKIKNCSWIEVLRIKDYIRKPKRNGYQSYHILVRVQNIKVEIQLRTILMDAWSSLEGVLVYKKEKNISVDLADDIKHFAKWSRRMDRMVHRMLKYQNSYQKRKDEKKYETQAIAEKH